MNFYYFSNKKIRQFHKMIKYYRDCLSAKQSLPGKRRVDGPPSGSITSSSSTLSSNNKKLNQNYATGAKSSGGCC